MLDIVHVYVYYSVLNFVFLYLHVYALLQQFFKMCHYVICIFCTVFYMANKDTIYMIHFDEVKFTERHSEEVI